jgi:hypothetical protein
VPPTDASTDAGTAPVTDLGADPGPGPGTDNEDTLDLRLPDELLALLGSEVESAGGDDLLDRIGGWGPIATPVGAFHLVAWSVISRSSPAG